MVNGDKKNEIQFAINIQRIMVYGVMSHMKDTAEVVYVYEYRLSKRVGWS